MKSKVQGAGVNTCMDSMGYKDSFNIRTNMVSELFNIVQSRKHLN